MSAAKYLKRPVVIEAVQWTGSNIGEVVAFAGQAAIPVDETGVVINTMEGPLLAQRGWWIIKGIKGEFYPCAPDVFDATYDTVPEVPGE